LGPVRVNAGGLVPPSQVLLATYATFGLAVACGAYLVAVAGPELLAVGAASILAGVLYTGGPRPYGYEGLGEVFVFLFFGIVAVTGSYYVQAERLTWEAFALAVPVGLLAAAILVVNNVRDLETDRRAGKRTLAVRLGPARATVDERALLEGRVRAADGTVGRGEAAPLEPYDGVRLADVRAEVEACRDLLADGDAEPPGALRAACRRRCSLPHALAALDV